MVNEDRVKRKLPTILVNGSLNQRQNFNDYQLTRYKLRRLEKKNPPKFKRVIRKAVKALEEIENALESVDFEF